MSEKPFRVLPELTEAIRHFWKDGREGDFPLNTDGGQLSAGRLHGFSFLHEACVQLWGEGGERQVPGDPAVAVAAAGGGTQAGCLLLTRR